MKIKGSDSIIGISFIIYLIMCTISIVVICIAAHNIITPETEARDFSSNWVTSDNGDFSLTEISDSVTIKNTLPQLSAKDNCLSLRIKNINTDIFIDGEKVYSAYPQSKLEGKTPGTYYAFIDLKESYSNKTITINIDSPYKNDSTCNIKDIAIGDKKDLLLNEIRQKFFGFLNCFIIMFIGIVFICLSFPLSKYDSNSKKICFLGMFALVTGLWSLTETKLSTLLFENGGFFHLITGFSLVLIAPPAFMFFKQKHLQHSKIPNIIVMASCSLAFVISLVLHLLEIYDLHQTITITHISIGIAAIFSIYYAFITAKNSNFKDISFIGLSAIGVCAIADVILYRNQITNDNSLFIRMGIIVYILCLGYQLIKAYLESYNSNIKINVLKQLAYIDKLTGLYNRNSFTVDVNTANTHLADYDKRIIAIFDLNNLKHINDTYGHAEGDNAITTAANYITKVFNNFGKCYRIGGDEFVFISSSKMSVGSFLSCKTALHDFLREYNKKTNNQYSVIIATGYCIITKDVVDINDSFKIADKIMYDDKRKIKLSLEIAGKQKSSS